jgi:hypothetical protein
MLPSSSEMTFLQNSAITYNSIVSYPTRPRPNFPLPWKASNQTKRQVIQDVSQCWLINSYRHLIQTCLPFLDCLTLPIKVPCSTEMLVTICHFTWHNNPGKFSLHSCTKRTKNLMLTSHIFTSVQSLLNTHTWMHSVCFKILVQVLHFIT